MAPLRRSLKNPKVRDLVCQDYVSPERRERRLRELFGLAPKTTESPEPAGAGEKNPVKPSQTGSGKVQPGANQFVDHVRRLSCCTRRRRRVQI